MIIEIHDPISSVLYALLDGLFANRIKFVLDIDFRNGHTARGLHAYVALSWDRMKLDIPVQVNGKTERVNIPNMQRVSIRIKS